ncbi:MAG: tetratricopeptide repeat protein [Pseudomonadota bacterium]
MRKLSWKLLLVSGVLFVGSIVHASGLEDRLWHEVSSKHFTLYSLLPVTDATELLHNLELLRAAIPALTNIEITESPIKTVIISVESAPDLRKLGVSNRTLGLFASGKRENLILVRDSKFSEDAATILHEYVHYLSRSGRVQAYPVWFAEGFAEYFSSAVLNGDSFEVGRFPSMRRRSFHNCHWLSAADLISGKGRGHCMFYASAWAAVHYLQTYPDHADHFADYLRRIEQQEDSVDAFREAFGINITTFNSRLKRYVRKGDFDYIGLSADELLRDFETKSRSVSREEISHLLGNAALRLNQLQQARAWYEVAVEDAALAGRARAGLGNVATSLERHADAEAHFNAAYRLSPDDPIVLLDIGRYWLTRARLEKDESLRDGHLVTARKYIGKSWQIDDSKPETYALYGRSFLLQRDHAKAIDTLEAANRLLPSNLGIRIELAGAYVHTNRLDEADVLTRSVKAWAHPAGKLVTMAETLMVQIDEARAAVSSAAEPDAKSEPLSASERL